MKKIILVAAAALCSFALNAQIYVGGSLGFNTNSNKNTAPVSGAVTTTGSTTFTIAPNAGIILNDKLSAGGRLNLSFGGSTAPKTSSFGFGINPYARYNILNVSKFTIAGEAGLSFNLATGNTTYTGGTDKSVSSAFRVYVEPVLLYALTENVTLEAALHIAQLNFSTTSTKVTNYPDSGSSSVTTNTGNTNFGLGLDTNDIFGTGLGTVSIGFTYKF